MPRVDLSKCTSWKDLADKAKYYDDYVIKEKESLEKIKEVDRDPTQKELLEFYKSFTEKAWDPTLTDGKVFDNKIPLWADKFYNHLDGDKGSRAKTQMEADYIELTKEINELKSVPVEHHHHK